MVNTAEIAANVKTETIDMYERMAASATFSGRELGVRKWMLDSVTVDYTDTTVTVRFGRGSESLADQLGTALLDRAAEHLPFEQYGRIDNTGQRTLTLTF